MAAKTKRPRGAAKAALLDAAVAEFEERGFEATDTNRIARRAGYAPQTFYRHYADKLAIFLDAYARWRDGEWADLESAFAARADAAALFATTEAHHRRHKVFRRALRRLAVENDRVREARGQSRAAQIARLIEAGRARDPAHAWALMLLSERFADALAEGETRDVGVNPEAARQVFIAILGQVARA